MTHGALSIVGLLILILPFYAVFSFRSLLRGFLTIFMLSAGFQILLAIITQSLHFFSYSVVLIAHIIFSVLVVLFGFVNRKKYNHSIKINWSILASFAIILFLLVSLHFHYTGIVDTGIGGIRAQSVQNSSYPYPFYSDEWSAVSFITYSIESGSLPFANPLNANTPFINFLAGFHSLVSELILLLNFNPLTQYIWIAIANGILTCALVFLVLRKYGVNLYPALIATLTIPFITTSGNLAGILYLVPYSLSFNFLLIGVLGFLIQDTRIFLSAIVASIIIYPPMLVFLLPMLVVAKRTSFLKAPRLSKALAVSAVVALLLFLVIYIGINDISLSRLIDKFISLIIRGDDTSGIVSFKFWNVIPIFIIPFVAIGLFGVKRRNFNILLYPIVVGIIFWVFYSFYSKVIIIEQTRIVSITSILLVMVGAFGIEKVITYFSKRYAYLNTSFTVRILKLLVLVFFALLSIFYSKIGLWHKLILETKDSNGKILTVMPSPPVTRYLSNDDLRVFEGIRNKVFISPRWKGLVIGVATHNYPLDSKTSTITNKILTYRQFMDTDCDGKIKYAKKYKIDYAYTYPFSCPGFQQLAIGDSGLVLYSVSIGI